MFTNLYAEGFQMYEVSESIFSLLLMGSYSCHPCRIRSRDSVQLASRYSTLDI
jgi:hypothetical protein